MKITKQDFLYGTLSNKLVLFKNILLGHLEELPENAREKLCNAKELDIKVTVNDIDILPMKFDRYFEEALSQQFSCLTEDLIDRLYKDRIKKMQDVICDLSVQLQELSDKIIDISKPLDADIVNSVKEIKKELSGE